MVLRRRGAIRRAFPFHLRLAPKVVVVPKPPRAVRTALVVIPPAPLARTVERDLLFFCLFASFSCALVTASLA